MTIPDLDQATQADFLERLHRREPAPSSRHYPHAPGAADADTSRAAAAALVDTAATLRAMVLRALQDGPATADETAARLDRSILSIRPRFSELRRHRLIIDTGERRPNRSGRKAIVWRATEA